MGVFADEFGFSDYALLGVILIIDGFRKSIVVIYSFGFYGSVAVIVIFLLIAISIFVGVIAVIA